MCKIGWLIANNGWDTKYNLVKYNLGVWGTNTKKGMVWDGIYALSLLFNVWFWSHAATT